MHVNPRFHISHHIVMADKNTNKNKNKKKDKKFLYPSAQKTGPKFQIPHPTIQVYPVIKFMCHDIRSTDRLYTDRRSPLSPLHDFHQSNSRERQCHANSSSRSNSCPGKLLLLKVILYPVDHSQWWSGFSGRASTPGWPVRRISRS